MRRWPYAVLACLLALGLFLAPSVDPAYAETAIATRDLSIPVRPEPDGQPVELDVRWYAADSAQRPTVVLAHGFGGSKEDLDGQARELVERGYHVLTYTSRGFGASGGRVHLTDPEFEVRDLVTLIDWVAERPEAQLDDPGPENPEPGTPTLTTPGDPRIGVMGASYGGAIALMGAAADPRIDAIVPIATWFDLGQALFPNHAVPADPQNAIPGPLNQRWLSALYGGALAGARGTADAEALCGRFDHLVCLGLLDAADRGRPRPEVLAGLRLHSPVSSLSQVEAPTLLIQGMNDSLFGLDQADQTARALAEAGTPHAVRWTDGGHDGPASDPEADEEAAYAWLDTHLRGVASETEPFTFAGRLPAGPDARAPWFAADHYPGLSAAPVGLPFEPSEPQVLLNPPGGQPASVTRIPGAAATQDDGPGFFQAYGLAALPGQSAAFDSKPVAEEQLVVGAPRVRLRVTSTSDEVTLFVSLWQVNAATAAQPRPGVAPIRARVIPGEPTDIDVDLAAATWMLEPGGRWRVLVTSTDSAYANPTRARGDRVEVVDGQLLMPTVAATPLDTAGRVSGELVGVLILLAAVLLALAGWAAWVHRRRVRRPSRPDDAHVPIIIDGLVKTYPDGHRAVDDVSWRAEKGQVVGLLGPNGAGKTTTMRMMLGLIRPEAGAVWVLGQPVTPGAAVLGQVGALVEGPGFLPHLTGRQNLTAYWAATGRPGDEAAFDEAIGVAALGGALDRPVRTYSHGMKQRLGIAQAMLGRPDLLILDEPTNGLDPPQIAAMRPILQAYAATGRTVVISSHLLAEVEQTCTHVVVMDRGRVLATGPVAELLDAERDPAGVRPHLEEIFLGIIGSDRSGEGALVDRLREVRPR